MSRAELYPWSLLTEVGDYFAVPSTFKPHQYMSQLVAQRNYKAGHGVKLTACKTSYGTIVFVAQVGDEKPPYEFLTPEGIMAVTSRDHLLRYQTESTPLGERAVRPKRTVSQIVEAMSWEMRTENLPWWYDNKGQLVFNAKIATEEDTDKWYRREKMPGKDDPYPEYYNLDENLTRKSRSQVMEDEEPEEEDFFELLGEGGEPKLENESDDNDV